MSLSAFITTSLAASVGATEELDNETVSSSESGSRCSSSVCRTTTKASHCHPLQEEVEKELRPPPSESGKEATSDDEQKATQHSTPSMNLQQLKLEKSRSSRSLLLNDHPVVADLESQLVTLKYELAQIKSELDNTSHLVSKLTFDNEQLKIDILQSRTKETHALRRATELDGTVRTLQIENERMSNDTSTLTSRLSKADSIADAIQCCNLTNNNNEMKSVIQHISQLAQKEHQSQTQQIKVENDNLRLFAKKIFVEKKKLIQERDELRGRLNEMMSVSVSVVANTDAPAEEEKGLRGMLTKMTSNRRVVTSSTTNSSSVGVSQRSLMNVTRSSDPAMTMTTVPVETLLWSST